MEFPEVESNLVLVCCLEDNEDGGQTACANSPSGVPCIPYPVRKPS